MRNHLFIAAALYTAVIGAVPAVAGGIPPSFLYNQQNLAPENLEIRADSVERTVKKHRVEGCQDIRLPSGKTKVNPYCFYDEEHIRVAATVLKVTRSKSQRKPGQTIWISYGNQINGPAPACGPGSTPILKQGKTYPAFLSKMPKGDYIPHVPGPHSFANLSEDELRPIKAEQRFQVFGIILIIGLCTLLVGGIIWGFRFRNRPLPPQ